MIATPLVVGGLLALVAIAGAGAYWYFSREDAGGDFDSEDVEVREQVAAAGETVATGARRVADAVWGTAAKRARLRMAGAVLVVGAVFAALTVVAISGWGLLSGALFLGGLFAGATLPPAMILGFRDGLPGIVGIGLAIAGQVAFGKAGLVRREDGQYEWGALREDRDGYFVRLDTGDTVRVDADRGELFAFGFGQLAVAEAHGANVDPYRETDTPGDSEQSTETRAGFAVAPPREEDGGILVTLAKIQRAVRGSASSKLVRRGRDKALDDAGGTGQISQLWTMAFSVVLLIVGFGMTIGALML